MDRELGVGVADAQRTGLARAHRLSDDFAQARDICDSRCQLLCAGTLRLDQITKELVELGLRQSELEVRLREARQSLEIPAENVKAR